MVNVGNNGNVAQAGVLGQNGSLRSVLSLKYRAISYFGKKGKFYLAFKDLVYPKQNNGDEGE